MPSTPDDPSGFEQFYAANHARLVSALVVATGQIEIAGDATDEAFSRAWALWPRVSTMESPEGWTYRVALNVARRRTRRAALERRLLARHRPVATIDGPAGEAWALVRDLPSRQRTAVVLRFVADLTEAQIAEAMGIGRSTVSSTLADATRTLARALIDEPEPSGGSHG